jgi:hypothetical protein
MTRFRKMIGRTLAIAALVGCATFDVVPLTHAEPIAVSTELLQQASIITPEGITVDPNNKEELKKMITATTFLSWRIPCERSLA